MAKKHMGVYMVLVKLYTYSFMWPYVDKLATLPTHVS